MLGRKDDVAFAQRWGRLERRKPCKLTHVVGQTPSWELMSEIPEIIAFSFHTCMFQARRKKDTAIWTPINDLNFTLSGSAMDSMNICNGAVPILTMVLQLLMSTHTTSTCAHHGPRPFLILPSHRVHPSSGGLAVDDWRP